MGKDRIRHLIARPRRDGRTRYHWQPSKTIVALGLSPEALGTDETRANARAAELNSLADQIRITGRQGSNGPRPGTVAKLFLAFKASEEFGDLKPRTRRDYAYYMDKIEADFGAVMVRALTARVIKEHYKRVRRAVSVTWGYHILSTWRTVLSWGAEEGWRLDNPAKAVRMKGPPRRLIVWEPIQAKAYIAKAHELGWPSIAAMAHVFDSIGQSPVDVRTLLRKAYDGRCIEVARAKTGMDGAAIPLFPLAKAALDAYLEASPRLPEAPLFTHDHIGGEWKENTIQKVHRKIRAAAGLPMNLQLQDFRTTAQTEGGAAGGTVDELRGLARHSTRDAGEHYVKPDARYIESIQEKRLAHRNKARAKI